MNALNTILLVLQILAALAMMGLILIQQGKGADMGAAFGSGASGSLFGAAGSANFLSRTTAILATVFFLCTLGLAYTSSHRQLGGDSVLDKALNGPVAPVAPSSDAQIPGGAVTPVAPAVSGAAQIPGK